MLIGLLSDTHIPYRAPKIPDAVLDALRGVDLILHAGDVDEPWALGGLWELAPVYAVQGNYHIFDRSSGGSAFPVTVEIEVSGFHIAMIHGHQLGLASWFWKAWSLLNNLRGRWELPAHDRAIARTLLRRFPHADIIVFGHTHRFYQAQWDRVLLINPGAALQTAYFDAPFMPTVVRLGLAPGEAPKVDRVFL